MSNGRLGILYYVQSYSDLRLNSYLHAIVFFFSQVPALTQALNSPHENRVQQEHA